MYSVYIKSLKQIKMYCLDVTFLPKNIGSFYMGPFHFKHVVVEKKVCMFLFLKILSTRNSMKSGCQGGVEAPNSDLCPPLRWRWVLKQHDAKQVVKSNGHVCPQQIS